jgi:phosphotransferase family enzyme
VCTPFFSLDNNPLSFYHTGMNEFNTIVIPHLQMLFQETFEQIRPWGEPTSWSCVYRLDLVHGTHLFVKGTPRTRAEALVSERLGSRYPPFAPHVLISDLLPTSSWRWFVLEDAGESQKTALTPSQACTVARALGTLQRCTESDPVLPNLLTDCSAYQIYQQLLAVCFWAIRAEQTLPWRDELHRLTNCLESAHAFFDDLAATLSKVPTTIIHGDLWPGNLVLTETGTCFLDWGDALWGIGGTSLAHLLLSSSQLEQDAPLLWDAYQQGRGFLISQAYRDACTITLDIVDLVIDQAIASCSGQGPEQLKGLRPGLQRIVAQIHHPFLSSSH